MLPHTSAYQGQGPMTRAARELIVALLLLFSGIGAIGYWLFGDMITRGARVENLDAYVSRAMEGAKAGRFAESLKAAVGDRYHDPKNGQPLRPDPKSTRLNSSHPIIS